MRPVTRGSSRDHASGPDGRPPSSHVRSWDSGGLVLADGSWRLAVDTLVANLRVLWPEASDRGQLLSLEPHVLTTVGDVDTTSEVVDAVGHPALRIDLDLVNLLGTTPAVYHSTSAVRIIGRRLGRVVDLAPARGIALA